MGFNYAKEYRKFYAEWKRCRQECEKAGMAPDTIESLYHFDLNEFRSRRRYETWAQPMPDRYSTEDHVGTPSLWKNYERLSTTFDEADFFGETAWLDTIEDPTLLKGLKKLPQKDLELLRFIVLEGHTQKELAQKWHCSQSSISKHFLRIKKFLRNFQNRLSKPPPHCLHSGGTGCHHRIWHNAKTTGQDEAVREMSPSERRSEILHLLCKRRHETAGNLAAEFDVSERTIRADLVILSCCYPIQAARGRFGGGIYLPDWFRMESRTLSPEQQALLMKIRETLAGDDLQVINSILAQFALYWEYR